MLSLATLYLIGGLHFMHLQKAKIGKSGVFWLVLGDDYLPIEPITEFLLHFKNINNSSSLSLHTYASRLKIYWEYLISIKKDWKSVRYSELEKFIQWLRFSSHTIIPINESIAKRSDSTINNILSVVSSFYQFQKRLGKINIQLTEENDCFRSPYKSLLHHLKKTKPGQQSLLKVKQHKQHPKTLTRKQVQSIKSHCTSYRDKLLISLLYETGVRIGEALGLHHEDMKTWNNEINICRRDNNENNAYSKSKKDHIVHVSSSLMGLYADYVMQECQDIHSDFVFVNLREPQRGRPYRYQSVQALFNRLSKQSGVHVTPHLFRHTHATELIQAGWEDSAIQKRLGHASVQTTVDLYAHLSDEDLKTAIQKYHKEKGLS